VAARRVLHEPGLASALVAADVASARRDWEDAARRLEAETRDAARAEPLRLQVEVLTDELRKRVGGTYTLAELAAEYRRAEAWVRHAIAERAPAPGWPRTLTVVEGAAFNRYARGAVDYEP
jgi:hypothetical protein